MGRLPGGNSLTELIIQGSPPDHAVQTGGVAVGWSGPYIVGGFHGSEWVRDGWNQDYQFSSTTGQITSAGRHGAFGTSDDLELPDRPMPIHGPLSITVPVDDALAPGTTITRDDTTAKVDVYFVADGVETALKLA